MTPVLVTLPCGFEAEGVWHRQAWLRPVLGEDEDYLQTVGAGLLPVERLIALLARCLERLGPWPRVTLDGVRGLAAGDLNALALHLRRLTFGDRLDCAATCPACGERMELELNASGLILPSYRWEGRLHYTTAPGEPPFECRLRLPTGRDLEEMARAAISDPARARSDLIRACVVLPEGGPLGDVPPSLEAQIVENLARLDPQADLLIEVACPGCGESAELPFDPAGFLFGELERRATGLYREVHTLALHYHWSEHEILGMPARKRAMYLKLLADSPLPEGAAA